VCYEFGMCLVREYADFKRIRKPIVIKRRAL